jgi:MAM domain.
VKQIIYPLRVQFQAAWEPNPYNITVEIENRGINAASNIPISYSINGGAPVTEIYTGTLSTNQTATFTFSTQATLNLTGTNTIVAWTQYSGDMNIYNDTASHTTIFTGGASVTAPVIQDFQSFTNCPVTTNCDATICPLGNGWINAANGTEDDIDWRVHNGPTASANTGPPNDHTLGTSAGKYIYLEASNGCNFQEAILTSPCIDLSSAVNPQLTFWYHMYGTNMGTLSVDVLANGVWFNNVIPTISGNQGNQWLMGTVNLTPYVGQNIVVSSEVLPATDLKAIFRLMILI